MVVSQQFTTNCKHHSLSFASNTFSLDVPKVLSLVFLKSQLNCQNTVSLTVGQCICFLPTHSHFPTVSLLGHFSSLSQKKKKRLTYVGHWETKFTLATSWCVGEFMREKANSLPREYFRDPIIFFQRTSPMTEGNFTRFHFQNFPSPPNCASLRAKLCAHGF